jgi:hypothetical protein
MRRGYIKPESKPGPWYRVRFAVEGRMAQRLMGDVATSHPGTIKNNLPKARRVSTILRKEGRDVWIERLNHDTGEWERFDV